MNRQRPVILLVLVAYIFLPSLINWVTQPSSAWYKPFIIWALVIVAALVVQLSKRRHDL